MLNLSHDIVVMACNLFLIIKLVLLQLRRLPADSELPVYITNAVFRKFPVHVRVSFQSRAA
jgi:hypothetical protein